MLSIHCFVGGFSLWRNYSSIKSCNEILIVSDRFGKMHHIVFFSLRQKSSYELKLVIWNTLTSVTVPLTCFFIFPSNQSCFLYRVNYLNSTLVPILFCHPKTLFIMWCCLKIFVEFSSKFKFSKLKLFDILWNNLFIILNIKFLIIMFLFKKYNIKFANTEIVS